MSIESRVRATDIDDVRHISEFKGITFSGFKKTEVRNQMLRNMIQGRIEQACYWCAELVCAGQYLDAWENIFHFMSKHIHLGNPKMPIYVAARFNVFRNIVSEGHLANELEFRNHPEIRKLFAEVICNLTLSPKKPSFEAARIQRQEEFDMTQINDRLKAPSTEYACGAFRPKDPRELFIAVNEFAYQLAAKNMTMCYYWIEWVIEFEVVCRSRKQPVRCEARDYVDDRKYRCDIVWMLWDAIMESGEARAEPFVNRVLSSLLDIFRVKYTTAVAKKRRYVLYMAVELLSEPITTNVEIVADKAILVNVVEKIDSVYKQVKKNEQRGTTDYLFSGIHDEGLM
ncbi:hypothetical protein EB093_08505 [bacterium]|nr:hypothetical protein [bacterium]